MCSTSENLPKLQAEGLFDHNLLQALSTVSLRVPALDEHKEDIPDLAVAIANLQLELAGIEYREFDIAALNGLRNANWPGDLAQLDAVIRNLIQTSLGEKITLDDVNRIMHQFDDASTDYAHGNISQNKDVARRTTVEWHPENAYLGSSTNALNGQHLHNVQMPQVDIKLNQPLREARDDFERLYFAHHLKDVTNNMSKLAEIAGLERTHLYRKLKQLGIKIKG